MSRFVVLLFLVLAALFGWWLVEEKKPLSDTPPISDNKPTLTNWRHFTSPSGKFDALFPALPQHATDLVNDGRSLEMRKYEMFVAEHNDGSVFMITQITLPTDVDVSKPNAIYQDFLQEMLKSNPQNTLKEQHSEKVQNQEGLEFVIENDQANIHGQVFLIDHDLFVLSHILKKDQVSNSSFKQFVQSFNYHNPNNKQPQTQ